MPAARQRLVGDLGRPRERNQPAGFGVYAEETLGDTDVQFLDRLLLHYGIYRRYPLRPWPAFKNAWRISFR